uniref:Uncharacterized protein n=1 Tax=Vespula pensylvanica TaxID=30213 RepID=A0A834NX80_VESPE|nr:hypothetical protein H0235_010550 [Vespula pensylvanica]
METKWDVLAKEEVWNPLESDREGGTCRPVREPSVAHAILKPYEQGLGNRLLLLLPRPRASGDCFVRALKGPPRANEPFCRDIGPMPESRF